MKRLLLLLLLLQAMVSCTKVLDKKPTDFVEPGNYYNSESELNLALNAVYDILGNENMYCSSLWFQLGICTDEAFYAFSSNSYSAPMFYQFEYTNAYVTGLWQQCYIGIERANLLIANINRASMDETKRQVILGEALFLRAYYHFLLVSNYGKVPLKLTPSADVNSVNVPAATIKEVYEQILADMKSAETKVKMVSQIGNSSRISKTTVQGIMARVCLNMAGYPLLDDSKYAEALHWTEEVVKSNEHTLRTTYNAAITNSAYSQIFIDQCQDIYEVKESMWEADFNTNSNNTAYWEMGKLGTMNLACNNIDTGFAGGNIKTTIKLYNLYGAGDLRRDWVICPYYYSTSSATTAVRANYTAANVIGREAGKWRRSFEKSAAPKLQYTNGTNFPILRFADVLLMQAEADNAMTAQPSATAYNAINQVRRRAYGLPINSPSTVADLPANLSKTLFQQAIMDERARELCMEGLRKSDLIRWGKFQDVMSAMVTEINNSNASSTNKSRWVLGYFTAASSSKFLLLPVPSLEINVNKALIQNPGW